MTINIRTVDNFPLLETFICLLVIRTIKDPISISISLIIIPIKKYFGIISLIQNKSRINTILSVKGSRIIPNFDTRLNLLATIPSNESLNPTNAIKTIRVMT